MRSLQSTINPGVALPAHIVKRQAFEQRMLRKTSDAAAKALGVDPDVSVAEQEDAPAQEQVEEVVLPEPGPVTAAPAALPQRPLRTQKLVLEHALFALTLDIYDLCVDEHFISFSLDYNAATLPAFKDVCDLEIKHQGAVYQVTYVGGSFNFPQHRLRAFAFVRRKSEKGEVQQ